MKNTNTNTTNYADCNEFKDCSTTVTEFSNFLKKCKEEYTRAFEQVGLHDKMTQDIMHKLELNQLSKQELYETAELLDKVRKNRRYYKDIVEELTPIVKFLDKQEHISCDLGNLIGDLKRTEDYHKTRTYIPRVLKDL